MAIGKEVIFNLQKTHKDWHPILRRALALMDKNYLTSLSKDKTWLPGEENIFNAFKLPLKNLKRILFGESPYPRKISANGYAFWDNAVDTLWSEKGLSKTVNRATSLRNFIKMLLLAENKSITSDKFCDKSFDKFCFVQTLPELFENMLDHGFLLLNATLVYRQNKVREDAKYWQVFLQSILADIYKIHPDTELILLGNFAKQIEPLIENPYHKIIAEHPYNLSFINNPVVLNYFRPLKLLSNPKG